MLPRLLILLFLSTLVIACSSSKKNKKTTTVATSTTDSMMGLNIIKSSDCVTCHSRERQLTGPSFYNIATRYIADQATIDKLANKIIKGGSSSWGGIPMTPHPSMSKGDAAIVVKYILSLKNKS